MKILISPAKSLDYTTALPSKLVTKPAFVEYAKTINEVLVQKTPAELGKLMKISENLSELNYQRNVDRSFICTNENAQDFRPAIFAFNGDVYSGLDAYSISADKYEQLQDKLRILSGLYGMLRPFDQLEPYRLEMGTKMAIGACKDLYAFWKPILTQALNSQTTSGELIVNLASKEYFSAIDKKKLTSELIDIDFKELRDGKLKIISFFAKKARGMMVRYIIDNNIEDLEGIKGFNVDGYAFSQGDSNENHLVFTR